MSDTNPNADPLKEQVRSKYSDAVESSSSSCCSAETLPDGSACMNENYAEVDGYQEEADLQLGCGLPTEHAKLQTGETVLDLGSGGGLDAFVARREVGPEGRVLGVDMTEAMIRKARQGAAKLDYDNVAFRLGEIEDLPVETDSVDVAISNCVLNLVPNKRRAFAEIHRVLRSGGGRFCISDIVSTGALPDAIREAAELHAGCVAGALPKSDYLGVIKQAGFADVHVAEERRIALPNEVLRPHLSDAELASFRASGVGLLSVTVLGAKRA
jgi:SAM-dependent methyltransferase